MVLKRVARASAMVFALALSSGVAHAESLKQALESAYANNPNIMSALLAVKEAAEDIVRAKSAGLPQISANAQANQNFAIAGGTYAQSSTYQLGMSYNQNLFNNGSTEASIEQARAAQEVSRYALRNAEQNVLLSVVQAYMGVIRDTQLVDLRSENMKFFEAQVNSANERLRLGEGTRIDVSQAQARLAQTVASYQAAVNSLATSQASYVRWVGHRPRNLSGEFRFGKLLPASIEQATNLAERQNPAILTAKAAIRAAQAGVDIADAAFGPALNLIGNIGASGNTANQSNPGSLEPTISGSVGLQLSVPIYRGGALGATLRRANLAQVRSEVDALATRDQVRESVISAWSALQNATAQIQSAQSAVSAGQEVVQGIVQERDVGQATTLDVLNSQAEVITAREGLITATASRMIASFSLLAAAGRLAPGDLGLAVAAKSADGYTAKAEDVWAELRALPDE